MRPGSAFLFAGAVCGVLAVGLLSLSPEDRFDHAEHASLFVTCQSCHAGISSDDATRFVTVTPADCASCHDGAREERTGWTEARSRPTGLDFSHPGHTAAVSRTAGEALECAGCHQTDGDRFMDVDAAPPDRCLDCHAHEAPDHLAGSECGACHVPLTSAPGLSGVRIAAFPEPADHRSDAFLFDHGEPLSTGDLEIGSCATCHARESCARCHLDAGENDWVQSLQPDDRVGALLTDAPGEWPEPGDHAATGFFLDHGNDGVQTCATCHAAESCTTCHLDRSVVWLSDLPRTQAGAPAGVELRRVRPPGHVGRFAIDHAVAAGANLPRCESCHAPTECADCHVRLTGLPASSGLAMLPVATGDEPRQSEYAGLRHTESGYHIENFVTRHGAEAFGVQTSCSDCHSIEVFCRDCHERSGVGGVGGAGAIGAYHDSRGPWLIGHGASARMSLEACASCHQQTSCLRCHSAKSGLRINPHGPGFRADRLAARSTISCGLCHTANQIPPP